MENNKLYLIKSQNTDVEWLELKDMGLTKGSELETQHKLFLKRKHKELYIYVKTVW